MSGLARLLFGIILVFAFRHGVVIEGKQLALSKNWTAGQTNLIRFWTQSDHGAVPRSEYVIPFQGAIQPEQRILSTQLFNLPLQIHVGPYEQRSLFAASGDGTTRAVKFSGFDES